MIIMKHLLLIFSLLIYSYQVYAASLNYAEQELYINSNLSEFFKKADWINLDSSIDYISPQIMRYDNSVPEDSVTLQLSYYDIFDYVPDTENCLIDSDGIKDLIFIKSENDVRMQVTYKDLYNNDISANYPKLYYKKDSSSDPWSEISFDSVGANKFLANVSLNYGSYQYYVVADNENYPNVYSSAIKTFIVTERPHSFVNLNANLQDNKGNQNTNIKFSWSAEKGVENDILKYTLYLGTDQDSMKHYELYTENSYVAASLSARTRYYWKIEVENQYGAKLLDPQVFTFVTLGAIERVYNAPNPFNPQKGEKTRIFFEMPEDGSANIDVYSEYGDKIWHLSADNLSKGSNEIVYDGKDDYGNMLYNGTYLCVVKKEFAGQTKIERCRLLIIK